jgi:hypothetical protein
MLDEEVIEIDVEWVEKIQDNIGTEMNFFGGLLSNGYFLNSL